MQPLPEIRAQLDELTLMSGGEIDMAELLSPIADLAVAVVPSCVGVSITLDASGTPITITATAEEFAVIDATQYLDGGPCVAVLSEQEALYVEDMLDEKRWHICAQAAA